MKDNLLIHPEEAKRRERINLIYRLISDILDKGAPTKQTYEEWCKLNTEDEENGEPKE
jgi:hypothetical protein